MNTAILFKIYEAVKENKWLVIDYINSKKELTNYFIGINDIDFKRNKIYCEIFNPSYDLDILKEAKPINLNNIIKAQIVDNTFYESSNNLIEKLDSKKETSTEFNQACLQFDNNIIRYLSECYKNDNDPYLKEEVMIDGIDFNALNNTLRYKLNDDQFKKIILSVFKTNEKESENIAKYRTLCLNILSIDINNKEYVVAYRPLYLNFANKTLSMTNVTLINKSFLVDDETKLKRTISNYLDVSKNDFCTKFDKNKEEFIKEIQENLNSGEKINTRPLIFILENKYDYMIFQALNTISEMDYSKTLTYPLKAFFNCNLSKGESNNKPNIVVYDKSKLNIEQIRAIYCGLTRHITYVKGPPGTGKTETIYNLIITSLFNNKTLLLTSNNNHPMNDVMLKFKKTFDDFDDLFDDEILVFPIIRLGNKAEVINTLNYLKKLVQLLKQNKNKLEQYEVFNNLTFDTKLKQLLIYHEQKEELKDEIIKLQNIKDLNTIEKLNKGISIQIESKKEKLKYLQQNCKDEDILNLVQSIKNDDKLKHALKYIFLTKIKNLFLQKNKKLLNIISACDEDIDEASKDFDKYLKDDDNFKNFLKIFPIVISTNQSVGKLGDNKPNFDLVVIDEAAQCNMVSSLVAILRSKNLLLVGDTNQLKPVSILDEAINNFLMNKYNIDSGVTGYNYNANSIMSIMLNKDKNSKIIFLKYHYRCAKYIIKFPNERYYKSQLDSLNQNNGKLIYLNVNNKTRDKRNSYFEEAYTIVKFLKENNFTNVFVVAPFVNQAELINKMLKKENVENIKAGTIHTTQGSEYDTIILSSSLSFKTSKKVMDWINENFELLNVAITRAKNNFVFAGDKAAIDELSKAYKEDEKTNEIKALSDYVFSQGKMIVSASDFSIDNFSNDSLNEKEFFKTIAPYFNYRSSKFKVVRNVPMVEALKKAPDILKKEMGKKEFDVVIYNKHLLTRYFPILAFEISGGEHIGKASQIQYDKVKQKICHDCGLKLCVISNNDVKDYETIIKLFESCITNNNMDSIQGTLFDEE